MSLLAFYARIKITPGCWEWTGYVNVKGYGRLNKMIAHRQAYEMVVGDLDPTLVIDHLCRNRKCVKPTHLEQVTNRENLLRGDTLSAQNVLKTVCPRQHPYSPENTYYRGRKRSCRTCVRDQHRQYAAAKLLKKPVA